MNTIGPTQKAEYNDTLILILQMTYLTYHPVIILFYGMYVALNCYNTLNFKEKRSLENCQMNA